MTTTQDPMMPVQQPGQPVAAAPVTRDAGVVDQDPLIRLTWTDPVTGTRGYLVVHLLVSGLATGGTRMRAGCTLSEVEDLARGMAATTAVFDLPVGGA